MLTLSLKKKIIIRTDLTKNTKFSKKILTSLFKDTFCSGKIKLSDQFLGVVFNKQLFFKNKLNINLLIYLKHLLNIFLSFFFFNLKQRNNITNKVDTIFFFKNCFSKSNLVMLKNFYYLIKIKKYNKSFFLLQKDFILYFLKNKKLLSDYNNKNFIKRFYYYLFNSNSCFLTKQNLNFFKEKISKTYTKQEQSLSFLVYNKLIGILTKKGKKSIATNILNKTLMLLQKDLKISANYIILKIINRLKVSIESKKVRIKQSTHLLPLPIKLKRKVFLISKWIFLGAKKQKFKKNFEFKLKTELNKLICSKESFAYKYKKYNIYKSLQNKSNIHFRW